MFQELRRWARRSAQNERMSGLIVPFFNFKPEAEGFVQMNEALKRLSEQGSK